MLALSLAVDAVAGIDQPRREIRFAVVAQFSPFQSRNPQGQLIGLNIELGNALCQQLNVRCTWVDQVLVENFEGLEARQFDAIMGIASTPQRRRRAFCQRQRRSRASGSGYCWGVTAKRLPGPNGGQKA
ncbi:bacterial extracellular solute-binding protein, family 3 domain-containing protein [Ditylenchus destructor]|nr:bacterial extracellular solute-binding protein, family 3 domain-containing protein [Ditylenchus destructor]